MNHSLFFCILGTIIGVLNLYHAFAGHGCDVQPLGCYIEFDVEADGEEKHIVNRTQTRIDVLYFSGA